MEYKFIHIPKCAGTSVRKALDIKEIGHFPVKRISRIRLNDIFTFSFVRNPYSRISSFYRYLKRDDIRNIASDNLSFEKWFYLTLVDKLHYYYYKPEFFSPCYNWLSIDDGIAVDFIGKVENIKEDWEKLCDILGKNVILEQHNSTTLSNEEFTEDMHEIMQEIFKKDFETWYPNSIR